MAKVAYDYTNKAFCVRCLRFSSKFMLFKFKKSLFSFKIHLFEKRNLVLQNAEQKSFSELPIALQDIDRTHVIKEDLTFRHHIKRKREKNLILTIIRKTISCTL